MHRLSATLLNLGKPDKAIFTFPEDPLILKFFAFSYIPGGKSFLSIHWVKVRFASILDTTISEYNSSPFSNTTPIALSFLTRILSTPELVRISPPCSRRAPASAFEIAPIPPRANPHAPILPSTSPIT